MSESPPKPISLPDSLGSFQQPVELYRGPVEMEVRDGEPHPGSAKIELNWQPGLDTRFRFVSSRMSDGQLGPHRIRGVPGVESLSVLVTGVSSDPKPHLSGVITGAKHPEVELTEIRFAITNMRRFIGSPLTANYRDEEGRERKVTWAGRHVVEGDEWRLTIDERRQASDEIKQAEVMGGYAVTHTACVMRRDGKPFSSARSDDLLDAIRGALALIRGSWCAPVLAVGLNVDEEVVWRDWTPPVADAWSGTRGPIDAQMPAHYTELFRAYMRRWNDPLWNEPLRFATHMYVEANSGITMDTTLFLCQTILELVAWVTFVEEKKNRVAGDFNGLRAADRIRELLTDWSISPAIPEDQRELRAAAAELNWADGPHALTSMRNAMVHPNARNRLSKPSMGARIELHQLALWYVELALLHVIRFDGEYVNRLAAEWVGDVESVPWVT